MEKELSKNKNKYFFITIFSRINNGEFNSQNASTSKLFSLEVVGERSVSEINFTKYYWDRFFSAIAIMGWTIQRLNLFPKDSC